MVPKRVRSGRTGHGEPIRPEKRIWVAKVVVGAVAAVIAVVVVVVCVGVVLDGEDQVGVIGGWRRDERRGEIVVCHYCVCFLGVVVAVCSRV